MVKVCFEVTPDELAPTAFETFAKAHGWRSMEQNGPVGDFAMDRLIDIIFGTLESHWGEQAATKARIEAVGQVRSNITIEPSSPD